MEEEEDDMVPKRRQRAQLGVWLLPCTLSKNAGLALVVVHDVGARWALGLAHGEVAAAAAFGRLQVVIPRIATPCDEQNTVSEPLQEDGKDMFEVAPGHHPNGYYSAVVFPLQLRIGLFTKFHQASVYKQTCARRRFPSEGSPLIQTGGHQSLVLVCNRTL